MASLISWSESLEIAVSRNLERAQSMVSPAKQLQKTSSSANEQADALTKDNRVKGAGPRLLLLFKKAIGGPVAAWDKVGPAPTDVIASGTWHGLLRSMFLWDLNHVGCLQEDLLDVLHWMRQLLAVVAGVAWGVLPLTGLYAFLG